jgi:hypothetical protein
MMSIIGQTFDLTADQWRDHGGRTPVTFGHHLVDEPLLQLDALAQLADLLDPAQIEVTDASAPTVVDQRITERLDGSNAGGRAAGVLVRDAEADRRWMAMRHIEVVPAYRRLVDGVFGEFCATTGLASSDAYRPEGYIFIGATGAVTPAHVDHEHNLFFQIRGTKRFTTGGFPDKTIEHRTFEGMYAHEYGSTAFAPADPTTHVLRPGDGLYVPPPAVHLVENDDSLAISFSLVFHDPVLDRTAKVYAFNSHLRQLRLRPRPPGRSTVLDRAKAVIVDGWRHSKEALDAIGTKR